MPGINTGKIKPTAVLKLEKGKLYDIQRDRAALEPTALAEIKPRCPKHFSKDERRAWKSYAAILRNYNLFNSANADTLERLATLRTIYSKHRAAYFALQSKLDASPGFQDELNPHLDQMLKIGTQIDRMVEKLGLTSVGLAKIGSFALSAKKKQNEFFND